MTGESSWSSFLTAQAERDLRDLQPRDRKRIVEGLERYVSTRQGDIQKIQGTDDEWRLRVGDWRLRFLIDGKQKLIVVLSIRNRREAYR